MNALMLSVIMQASMATGATNYAEAFKQAEQTGRPLVVLVGADWCPGCRTMKQAVVPQLAQRGILSSVAFAQVNTGEEPALAGKLMRGNSIPQLIVYRKTDKGWTRSQLTGVQSVGDAASFIQPYTAASSLSQNQ